MSTDDDKYGAFVVAVMCAVQECPLATSRGGEGISAVGNLVDLNNLLGGDEKLEVYSKELTRWSDPHWAHSSTLASVHIVTRVMAQLEGSRRDPCQHKHPLHDDFLNGYKARLSLGVPAADELFSHAKQLLAMMILEGCSLSPDARVGMLTLAAEKAKQLAGQLSAAESL